MIIAASQPPEHESVIHAWMRFKMNFNFMAWNPSPQVAAARDFGKKFSKEQVIILSIDLKANTLELSTYGETKYLCADAAQLGEYAYESIMRFMRDRQLDNA